MVAVDAQRRQPEHHHRRGGADVRTEHWDGRGCLAAAGGVLDGGGAARYEPCLMVDVDDRWSSDHCDDVHWCRAATTMTMFVAAAADPTTVVGVLLPRLRRPSCWNPVDVGGDQDHGS